MAGKTFFIYIYEVLTREMNRGPFLKNHYIYIYCIYTFYIYIFMNSWQGRFFKNGPLFTTCMHVRMHACMYVCMYIYTHIYMSNISCAELCGNLSDTYRLFISFFNIGWSYQLLISALPSAATPPSRFILSLLTDSRSLLTYSRSLVCPSRAATPPTRFILSLSLYIYIYI